MYHVAGTGITVLLLYLISYLFYRLGFYSVSLHRKLWNSVLAIAFLVSALAGIFMALQISYKWNVPNVKAILKWHVEFGIGLAATGLLHFIWHLPYFRKILSGESNGYIIEPDNKRIDISRSDFGINLFIIGFASTSFQLLMIREMMNISGGYELISGIFLGTWLILSAAGAALGGKSKLHDIRKINLVFALSPLISLFLMFIFGRLFLESGETPSVLVSIIYTFLVLIPFCLSSGFIFVKLISLAGETFSYDPGKSFSIETIGGIIAGIMVSLLISGKLGTYKMMAIIILLSITYTLLTYFLRKELIRNFLKILSLSLVIFIIMSDPDAIFRQFMLPGIKVEKSTDTPYGNITTGHYMGELSLYYNQRLLKYSDDVMEREEDVHYAMLQHKSPRSVVIISGTFETHLPELIKYGVKKITYIERDPALAQVEISDSLKEKITVSYSDAFSYFKKPHDKADVIIMLVPPPSTLMLNRYFTTDFFARAYEMLNKGGVFMCSPGAYDNYLNDESLKLYSSVFNSLKAEFKNVIPVAGNKLYFIASDNELKTSFCELTSKIGISNLYVSRDYLSDELVDRKSREISNLLDPEVNLNTSDFPLAYSYLQVYHLSKFKNEKVVVFLLLALLFAIPLFNIRRQNITMYFSASSLAGFEIIALLTLQNTAGNMYQMTGIIIAGLMAGLATGSGISNEFLSRISLKYKGLFLMIYYLAVALIYNLILSTEIIGVAIVIILILSFIPAFVTGNIFRELTIKNGGQNMISRVYSADLAGSAMGFIAVTTITIPVFGIIVTIFFLAIFVFIGFLFGTIMNKH